MKKEFFENKIEGFSRLEKKKKIEWIELNYFRDKSTSILEKYWNNDKTLQKIHDEFTENTLSNFYLPLGVAPNFFKRLVAERVGPLSLSPLKSATDFIRVFFVCIIPGA